MNLDSPSKTILESPFYSHYLPGPEYVITATMAIFGTNDRVFQWTRVIPMLSLLLAAILFFWAAERTLWKGARWFRPAAALLLLLAPGMRPWGISLHGHAYSSSYILAGLAFGILAAEAKYFRKCLAGAVAIGFCSNYMLLTGAFVAFFAPTVGGLLSATVTGAGTGTGTAHSDRSRKQFTVLRNAAILSLAVGTGLFLAYVVHFFQVVHQFGWQETVADQFGTIAARNAKLAGNIPSRVQMLGYYSNHCYTFWGISTLAMAALTAFLSWIFPAAPRNKALLLGSVLVAGLGSYSWIMIMLNHSLGHTHVNPRIFYLMFAAFISALGIVGAACQRALGGAAR
jgi:hypothetical protein